MAGNDIIINSRRIVDIEEAAYKGVKVDIFGSSGTQGSGSVDMSKYALLEGRLGDVLHIDRINKYTVDSTATGVTIEGTAFEDNIVTIDQIGSSAIPGGYLNFDGTVDIRDNDVKVFTVDDPTGGTIRIGEAGNDTMTGYQNILIGDLTGQSIEGGFGNLFMAYGAGTSATSVSYGVALGYQAMHSNLIGDGNVVIGPYAFYTATLGNNTVVGTNAARYINSEANVFVGAYSGAGSDTSYVSTATSNVAIGYFSLRNLDGGDGNVIIGWSAGTLVTDGNYNILIGYAQSGTVSTSYELRIGPLIEGSATPGSQWLASPYEFRTDLITEYTTDAGVTFDVELYVTGITAQSTETSMLFYNSVTGEIVWGAQPAPLSHTHVIANITDFTDNSTDWDTAYGWGNHAGLYALLSHDHVIADITDFTDNSTNWDTAYTHSQIITGNPHDISWSDLTGSQPSPITHTHNWSDITNTPTTLAGYGITNAYTITESDAAYAAIDHDIEDHGDVGAYSVDDVLQWSGTSWVGVPLPSGTSLTEGDGIDISSAEVISVALVSGTELEFITGELSVITGTTSSTVATGDHTHTGVYSPISHTHDHGTEITGLTDDDHTQYALLAGRNGNVLLIDEINEYNTSAGVTIEGVELIDGSVIIDQVGDGYLDFDGDAVDIRMGGDPFITYGQWTHNMTIGYAAGNLTRSGANTILIGYDIGELLTSAQANVIIGISSGGAITSSGYNIIIGYHAANTGDLGWSLVAGYYAAEDASGSQIVALGYYAMADAGSAYASIGIGSSAGRYLTGNYNVSIGNNAGSGSAGNSDGEYNFFLGSSTGQSITGGDHNFGAGYQSLYSNTSGFSNVAVGSYSLSRVTTMWGNTSIGAYSGQNSTGLNNVFIGYYAGQGVYLSTTGSGNVFIGQGTGSTFTTGGYNTLVGYNIDLTTATDSYILKIGQSSTVILEGYMSTGQWVGTAYEFRSDLITEYTTSNGVEIDVPTYLTGITGSGTGTSILHYNRTTGEVTYADTVAGSDGVLTAVTVNGIDDVDFTITGGTNITAVDFGHNIVDHDDVTFTSLATDDIMKWNGSAWINVPIPTGGSGNAWTSITDGTNTATAGAADTFRFRSANSSLTTVVTNADATYGDNLLITLVEANIDHNELTNYEADEHIDWTVTGTEDIHVDRITSAAVTQHEADIDHDELTNTHNLTTDIDHSTLTNTHNLTTDITHNSVSGLQGGTTAQYYHLTLTAYNALHAAVTVSDTFTIDLTLATQLLSADVRYQMSITSDSSGLKLTNDATSPGNSKLYGTDGAGVKGWYDQPTSGTPDAHASTHESGGGDTVNHDSLVGFVANEHIDWSITGATQIHLGRLSLFSSSAEGTVPASGGGTTNFLRADGTWNAPASGGSGTVTLIESGNGMNFSDITTSGTVSMGTPSTLTLSTTNSFPGTTSHTHVLSFVHNDISSLQGGTTAQYYHLTLAEYNALHVAVTVLDTSTINFGLSTQQITGSVIYQQSITADASGLKLSGDLTTPGNSKLYGTNSSGVRGWYDIPTSGTPTAHASTHEDGGADELDLSGMSGLLATAQTPIAHNHTYSEITNFSTGVATYETSHATVLVDGDFTTQGIMRRDSTSGFYSILTDNSSNWNAAYSHSIVTTGNPHAIAYSDLQGTQPAPLSHAASHRSGGSDYIRLDELHATTDVTTLNASTSAHGLLRKLSGVSTQYLSGTGVWSTPVGGGNVSSSGTPADNQLAIWTNSSTIEGQSVLTYDGNELTINNPAIGGLHVIITGTDRRLWRIGESSGGYGFHVDYIGTGSGDANVLRHYSENQTGVDINYMEVTQSGVISFYVNPTYPNLPLNNQSYVVMYNTTSDTMSYYAPAAVSNGASTLSTGDQIYDFVIGLGYSTTTGTVTQVNKGNGMNFTSFSTSGTITLGTPTTNLSGTSINSVSSTGHTHAITTGAVSNGATNLVDANDVYDFVIGLGYGTGAMDYFNVQANGGTYTAVTNGEELNFVNGTGTTAVVVLQTNPTVTFNHNDTSTLSGAYGSTSDGTKIDQITVDALGHVTAITTGSTGSMSSFNIQANAGTQVAISSGEEINFINGTGTTAVVVNQTNPTVTFNHNDTSTLSGVYGSTSNTTKIDTITVDSLGHITAIATGYTGGGSGTVTQVNKGNGMNFTSFTTTGTITLGTPITTLSGTTTNAVGTSSHTHAIYTFSGTAAGLVPISSVNSSYFLNGDGGWTQPSGTAETYWIQNAYGLYYYESPYAVVLGEAPTSLPPTRLKVVFSSSAQFSTEIYNNQTTGHALKVQAGSTSSTSVRIIGAYRSTSEVAYLNTDGKWNAVDFINTSDPRKKNRSEDIANGLHLALQLKPFYFTWKDPEQDQATQIGFSSIDVRKAHDSLVTTDMYGFESVSYARISVINNAAIHELSSNFDQMEKKVESNEARIIRLENKVKQLEEQLNGNS